MKRKPDITENAPGQDSFSDVVTNLVGIMIIMVTVVGVRAKDAMIEAIPAASIAAPAPEPDVAGAQQAAAAVQSDIRRLTDNLTRQDIEIAYRRRERDRTQLLVTAAKEAIEQRREKLNASQQEQFDAQRELINAQSELDELERQRDALVKTPSPTAIIQHLPTPMAKTVFGKELHFRLRGGRLAHVPWDELIEQLKQEAPHKVWRLKEEKEFTETLGPVGGFWMQYTLKRAEYTLPTKTGTAVQSRVELDRFVLNPVSEDIGEPVETALNRGSQTMTVLEQHRPAEATVTVWVYPDSFGQFRTLKQALYQLGYLTASRPLPDGFPIGGSPHGSKSAVE